METHLAGRSTASQSQPLDLGPFIMRVAFWPIETIESLCSPGLAKEVDEWLEQEENIRSDSELLSEALHALVPDVQEKSLRAQILAFRRFIHRTTGVISGPLIKPLLASTVVPLDLKNWMRGQAEIRVALGKQRSRLESLYDSSLDSELGALDHITSDPVFRKALCLAGPTAYRMLRKQKQYLSGQQRRKLDLALYVYVMRAVGRATPNGLWAGVAIEDAVSGQRDPIQIHWTSPGRVVFSPDLSFVVLALHALTHKDPWRKEIPLRINPTLFRPSSSVWQFGKFQKGTWREFQANHYPVFESLASMYSTTAVKTPAEIGKELVAQRIAPSADSAAALVDQMLDLGILWSTLELPGIYEDPWEATESVLAHMPSSERSYWEGFLRGLRGICDLLSVNIWSLSDSDLQSQLDAARICVNELLARYGVAPVPKETNVLIADSCAALRFSVSPGLRSMVEEALRAYWAFDRYGLGEAEAARERKRVFGELESASELRAVDFVRQQEAARFRTSSQRFPPAGKEEDAPDSKSTLDMIGPQPWETVLDAIDDIPLRARVGEGFQRWYRELEGAFTQHRHQLSTDPPDVPRQHLGPGSCLMMMQMTSRGVLLRIGSVTPDPCLFYSRFGSLFREGGKRVDSASNWWSLSVQRSEAQFSRLRFASLIIPAETNPNAASRPRVAGRTIDGLDRNDTLLSPACLRTNTSGRAVLYLPEDGAVILPGPFSAVSLNGSDPYSRFLSEVWSLLGRPSLMRPMPRFSAEITRWHHLPRLCLDATTVIAPERWTPPPVIVDELAASAGLERYMAWRRFVRHAGLPRLVYGQYGLHETPTLIPTDSILAVEHLGRALGVHGGTVLLQEAFPSPADSWLCDPEGRHYVAELAISWQSDPAFWREYLGDLERPGQAR